MSFEPLVRARHLKSILAAVDRHPQAAVMRARAGQAHLEVVERSTGLDWLPVDHNVALTGAVYEVLGPIAADRFFRDHTFVALDGPVLRTLVVTGLKIFGLDPAAWAPWIPKAWTLLFRGCGELSVGEARSGTVTLVLARLPHACAADPVWLRSVAHSFDALLDLARVHGVVELLPRAEGAPEATFRMRWAPRPIDR